MSAKITFTCDHENCTVAFTSDTAATHQCGACPEEHPQEVPVDLSPILRFLTDQRTANGGWEFALDKMPDGLLLFVKCFCPEHRDDIKSMVHYEPDKLARKRQQKALKRH